jgi:hypothetical protein
VQTGRLAPTLSKFARAGWTPRDVDLGVRDAMGARGWGTVPRNLKHPAAYLAGLLRDLDPADRPSVLEDAFEAARRAETAATRARSRAWLVAMRSSCPHGVPAGDVVNPATGALACRECRP